MKKIILLLLLTTPVLSMAQILKIENQPGDTTFILQENLDDPEVIDSIQVFDKFINAVIAQYRRSSRNWSLHDEKEREANKNKNTIETFIDTSYFDVTNSLFLDQNLGRWNLRINGATTRLELIRAAAGNARMREVDTPANGGAIRFFSHNMIEFRNYIPSSQGTKNVTFRQSTYDPNLYIGYLLEGNRLVLRRIN